MNPDQNPNRRFVDVLPFEGVNDIQMLEATTTSNQANISGNMQIRERLTTDADPFSLSTWSRYRNSWIYQVPPGLEINDALFRVHQRMYYRIPIGTISRIRIWYRDRQSVVRVPVQGPNLPNELVNSTHTQAFDNSQQFLEGYQELVETVYLLMTSNEELELEDLYFVLDVTSPTFGGGSSSKWDCKETHLNYRDTKGLTFVPSNVNLLCGWISLALHFTYWLKPNSCEKYGIPKRLFELIPTTGIQHRARRMLTKHFWGEEMNKSVSVMTKCGKFIADIVNGNTVFSPEECCQLIVSKWPWLKVVILGQNSHVKSITAGADWSLQGHSEEEMNRRTCYLTFEHFSQHYHYVNNVRQFSNRDMSNISRKKWCHGCLKMLLTREYAGHKCIEIKCNKCGTFFESQSEHDDHCKNNIPVSISSSIYSYLFLDNVGRCFKQ